jgi:hypothetical protein
MPATLQFFDMTASVTPPKGHLEPLVITLGPNWQPNDIRLFIASGSASETAPGGTVSVEMPMLTDPPPGFTAAYSLNPGNETHGVYYRRLVAGDDDQFVDWVKPPNWMHYMTAFLTVRGVDPGTNPTAGSLSAGFPGRISYITADSTDSTTVSSITVPHAGTMVFAIGNVAAPSSTPWPNWAVAMGVPSGWTPLVATPNSGNTYYQYDTNPCFEVVANSYSAAGSTGSVVFPTGQGSPAFAGLYVFLTPAPDVSVTVGAA